MQDEEGATLNRYPLEVHQVASPDAIAQLNYALTLVMQRGTGIRRHYATRGVAGKTGTSDDYPRQLVCGLRCHRISRWCGWATTTTGTST